MDDKQVWTHLLAAMSDPAKMQTLAAAGENLAERRSPKERRIIFRLRDELSRLGMKARMGGGITPLGGREESGGVASRRTGAAGSRAYLGGRKK
jgi:hypothetical protein